MNGKHLPVKMTQPHPRLRPRPHPPATVAAVAAVAARAVAVAGLVALAALAAAPPAFAQALPTAPSAPAHPQPAGRYLQSGPLPFADLHGTPWEQAAIPLWRLGIIQGVAPNRFAPYEHLTRSQLVALIVRAIGRADAAVAGSRAPFADVPLSHPAAGYLAYANRSGLVEGVGENLFRPDETVTYAEAMTMVYRAAGHAGPVGGRWPDDHVAYAQSLGLLDGLQGYHSARGLTRGDAVLLIHRLVFALVNPGTGTTVSQQVWQVPERLVIALEYTYLPPNTPVRLTAAALDAGGRPVPAPPVEWSLELGAETGAALAPDGTLTLGYGPGRIVARSGGLQARSTFAPLKELAVEPAAAVIRPGESLPLRAIATSVNGYREATAANWELASGPGSITAAGILTGDAAGTVEVRALLAGATATARILVLPGITVTPAEVVAFPGETVQFRAIPSDPALKHLDLPTDWAAQGADITPAGLLAVPDEGEVAVTATVGRLQAGAVVHIPRRLVTEPGGLSLAPGEAAPIGARVVDAAGRELDLPIAWRVEPADLGRATGQSFMAMTPGTGHLVASCGPLEARIPITVAPAAPLLRLSVSPDTLRAGGEATATVSAVLLPVPHGDAVSGRRVSFTVEGAAATLDRRDAVTDGTGVARVTLTPGAGPGRVTVRARVEGAQQAAASSTVTLVDDRPVRVALDIEPHTLAADSTSTATVTATLVDAAGTPVANALGQTVTIDLTPLGPELSWPPGTIWIPPGVDKGTTTVQAGATAGRLLLLGTASGGDPPLPVTPATAELVRIGPAERLVLRAPFSANGPDGPTWAVAAHVADSQGRVRTGDDGQTVTLTVRQGAAVLWSQAATVSGGAARFLLPADIAGAGQVTLTATAPALETSEIKFDLGTGGPDRLRLRVKPLAAVPARAGVELQLRAQVVDAAGRPRPEAGRSVTFLRVGEGLVTTPAGATTATTDWTGQAVLDLTATGRTGHDTWTAVSPGLGTEAAAAVYARAAGPPSRFNWWPAPGPHRAGEPVRVILAVTDAGGVALLGSDPTYRTADLDATGLDATWSATAFVDGLATVTVTAAAPGRLTLTASDPDGRLAPATVELLFTP